MEIKKPEINLNVKQTVIVAGNKMYNYPQDFMEVQENNEDPAEVERKVELIRSLYHQTGCGIIRCKKALEESGYDIEMAINILNSKNGGLPK